jgi:hypothetical protein
MNRRLLALGGLVVAWASPSSALQAGGGAAGSAVDTLELSAPDSVSAILKRHLTIRVTTIDGWQIPLRWQDGRLVASDTLTTDRPTFDLSTVTRIEHRDRDLAWGAQIGLLGGVFFGALDVGMSEMFDMFDQYDPGAELPSTMAIYVVMGTVSGLLVEALFPSWKTVYRSDHDGR